MNTMHDMKRRGEAAPTWRTWRRWRTAVLVGAAALLGSACTVVPPRVEYTGPRVAWVTYAPPPPRVEVIPVQPGPNVFWVAGHWGWDGRAHRWEDGHWEPRRDRERWVPHRWDQDGDGRWRQSGGYWRGDR